MLFVLLDQFRIMVTHTDRNSLDEKNGEKEKIENLILVNRCNDRKNNLLLAKENSFKFSSRYLQYSQQRCVDKLLF